MPSVWNGSSEGLAGYVQTASIAQNSVTIATDSDAANNEVNQMLPLAHT